MITHKTFHRKTKRGTIIKLVREHYLRLDIACGRQLCDHCDNIDESKRLSAKGKLYLIPDSSILLTQLDVLEDPSFGDDVIILQSVLNDVRQKNLKAYARTRALVNRDDRRFHVFYNEFHSETFQHRNAKEVPSEYLERMIDSAALWYTNHIGGRAKVFVLSNFPRKGCKLFKEHLEDLQEKGINLLDKMANIEEKDTNEVPKELRFSYPDHLPQGQLLDGIKSGKLHSGKYRSNVYNYLEGFVATNIGNKDIEVLIQGRECINRAIDSDTVVIEILPEDQWLSSSDVVIAPELDEEDESKMVGIGNKRVTGKVVGILRRNWNRQLCGSLKLRDESLSSIVFSTHLFVPSDRRFPMVRIESRQYDIIRNQRLVVALDSWPKDSKFPKGHYVRALGEIGDLSVEKEALLLQYDVPHDDFSNNVLKCLPSDPDNWTIPQEEFSKRLDLRNLCIASVDPPGCTDIDDALHCRILNKHELEVGVHIADVSYFIKENSPLDIEAAKRGTTVYLVDRRIDMIPTVLSSNLCSLIAGQERLTFSVIWTFDRQTGEMKTTKFARSIIKSRAALTYSEAQALINSNSNDELALSLRELNALAKKMKAKRLENGALVLASAGEIKFIEVESETHENVTQIQLKKVEETNSMVEEMMLAANISVAGKILETYPEISLLRRHPQPSAANFDELRQAAKAKGFDLDPSSGKSLSNTLAAANDPNNPYFNTMLKMLTTRCMTTAVYFCSGSLGHDLGKKHFGLAADVYTHFTSPIRRYADLMVHRLLSAAIGDTNLDPNFMRKTKIDEICENINFRHKSAQYASRSSNHLHTIEFINNSKRLLQEQAYVLQVKRNTLELFVPNLALQLSYFTKEPTWTHNAVDFSQKHIQTGTVIKVFDPVTIYIGVIDKSTQYKRGNQQVDIRIIEPSIDELPEGKKKKMKK